MLIDLAANRDAVAGKRFDICVIGGGEVFAACLPRAARMHLTHVDTVVEGADAFFPAFDPRQWTVLAREPHPADARHAIAFVFVDYVPAAGAEGSVRRD